ncbi:MAG TPA: hypothetical protein VK966_03520 [Longimicrobiales bacterium]|nr:hypothetical protein [Longimicrobiales bacterium]
MRRLVSGCASRLLVLAFLLAAGGILWWNRDGAADVWDRITGREARVSPEIAAMADEKLARLSNGSGTDRVALNASELQSLLLYRWAGFLPADVASPRVELGKGRVALQASVATARFGRVADLQEIVSFLPDTASLRAVGSFVPLDAGHVALEVHELGAAGIPVPRQLIPTVLRQFRGSGLAGLAPNAVAVPLPPGIRAVFISGDSMVFVANQAPSE